MDAPGPVALDDGTASRVSVVWCPIGGVGADGRDQGACPDAANAKPDDVTTTMPPVAMRARRPRRGDRVAWSSPRAARSR
ncbi:hypothetical protein [Nocardioides sp.]|uniref:hypothetical protein n=1 Tax=Nocardioides sp. TaxID=35761 RepID=UPI002F4082FB